MTLSILFSFGLSALLLHYFAEIKTIVLRLSQRFLSSLWINENVFGFRLDIVKCQRIVVLLFDFFTFLFGGILLGFFFLLLHNLIQR